MNFILPPRIGRESNPIGRTVVLVETILTGIQYIWSENSLRRNSAATVSFKTGRFDNIGSAEIIKSVSKAVQNRKRVCEFCTALLTLLMITAESMLSKRPILRFTVALFFSFLLGFHLFQFLLWGCVVRGMRYRSDFKSDLLLYR